MKLRNYIYIVFGLVLVIFYQNCSQQYELQTLRNDDGVSSTLVVPNPPPTQDELPPNPNDPPKCDLIKVTSPVKLLFIVDTSGSNANSSVSNGQNIPATDPQKLFRSGSIDAFYQANLSRENFSWGLGVFGNNNAKSLILEQNAPKFGNSVEMDLAIDNFNSLSDNGNTPYMKALDLAKQMIATDNRLEDETTSYVIVFMSDGLPTDVSDINIVDLKIMDILNLAPGRINLGAVYYSTQNNENAANVLKHMAVVGQGAFLNVNTSNTQSFDINQVVKEVPSGDCAQ